MNWEVVIGLEVHAQLLTDTKAFSPDANKYGEAPNTLVHPISLGHPGVLPSYNKRALELAVKMGIACESTITRYNIFARKNYFYADLPKGYQITQFNTPLCVGGFVNIEVNGVKKRIGLTRIHVEEDAGKSIHDLDPYYSLIDLNRAGVPLIEIVSEPDMRSSDEAYQYLTEIRKLVRYLEICDGNMEEGSLRCDANISVRKFGDAAFGQKVEVKNMNSIRNVKRAIDHEVARQIEQLESGQVILQETRSFDAVAGQTFSLRSKEDAHDYRYFPEPDLPPMVLSDVFIETVKKDMPALPETLKRICTEDMGLSDYDAQVLTEDRYVAAYFMELSSLTQSPKLAANWVMGSVKSWVNEQSGDVRQFPISPAQLAKLIELVNKGRVSHSAAAQQLFPALILNPSSDPEALAEKLNLFIQSDVDALGFVIQEVLDQFPDKVAAYQAGKTGLLGLFVGEVMKKTKGKADPKLTNELLQKRLNNIL